MNHPLRLVRPFSSGDASAQELLVEGESSWGTSEALGFAERLTRTWSASGVTRAKRVAFDATTGAASVLAAWTLIELGIPLVPLHPAWSPQQRQAVLRETEALEAGVVPVSVTSSAAAGALDEWRRPISEASELAVVHTSGSTGQPKGALLTHRAFWTSAHNARQRLGAQATERWGLTLPLAHVGGLSVLTRAATWGSTVVLPPSRDAADRSFDAHHFVEFCAHGRVSGVSLVPTQLQRIVAAGLPAPPCVLLVLLGGAPAPPSLSSSAAHLGWKIRRTYGLTEACSQVATDERAGAKGPLHLLDHVEARVDEGGRLSLRGEGLFSGYLGEPPRGVDEWFATSDLARLDGKRLTILGRADDVVISGGENIHPAEVDAVLNGAPGIAGGCAFGRSSKEWGQELCAVVVPLPDFSAAALLSYLRGRLPSYKIPKAWALAAQLPLSSNGKVHRDRCRELHSSRCAPLN